MKLLSLSLVVYNNSQSELKQLMDSMATTTLEYTFFVVDNSPTEALRVFFENYKVEYIYAGENKGFGGGHNIALKKVLGNFKYHVVINPDIYFEDAVLERMVEFMDKNTEVAHAMPKVLNPDGSIQYVCKRLPRPFDLFANRFLPSSLVKDRLASFEMRDMGYDKVVDVEFLSGCFMFLRTEALEEVGLFDENIFMYFEDVDLTRRLGEKYRTVFFPGAEVYHGYKRESKKNLKLLVIMIESMIYYFNKYSWFPLL